MDNDNGEAFSQEKHKTEFMRLKERVRELEAQNLDLAAKYTKAHNLVKRLTRNIINARAALKENTNG